MKIKKAPVFGETQGFYKSFEQIDFKPFQLSRQQKQTTLEFVENLSEQSNVLDLIECFECKQPSQLDGYRFRLVPICACCRTKREIEIVGNRFERRQRK